MSSSRIRNNVCKQGRIGAGIFSFKLTGKLSSRLWYVTKFVSSKN
jgi:hypothetical protein